MEAALAASRGASYFALLLVAGVPLYGLCAGTGLSPRGRAAVTALAIAAVCTSVWWGWASVAAMAGPGAGKLGRTAVLAVLDATPLGAVLETRIAALALLILAAAVLPARLRQPCAALCGVAALASAAWTGHAGAGEGWTGMAHRGADVLHLIAAAAWLGGLAVLLAGQLGGVAVQEQLRRLRGFAGIGTAIVAALLVSGMANTLFILGWPLPVAALSSGWAGVLAIKLALFAAMLALAANNRFRLVPELAAGTPGAAGRLQRSLAVEALAGIAIVSAVAFLGTMNPEG